MCSGGWLIFIKGIAQYRNFFLINHSFSFLKFIGFAMKTISIAGFGDMVIGWINIIKPESHDRRIWFVFCGCPGNADLYKKNSLLQIFIVYLIWNQCNLNIINQGLWTLLSGHCFIIVLIWAVTIKQIKDTFT